MLTYAINFVRKIIDKIRSKVSQNFNFDSVLTEEEALEDLNYHNNN